MEPQPSSRAASGYIDVNQLRAEHPVSPEKLFDFYGVSMPPTIENSRELRMACPFTHCGKKAPTGQKTIAIQRDARGFIWRCFHYGCSHGGNDVGFADLLRDEQGDGKPRGGRFREVLADYVAMANGESQPARPTRSAPRPTDSPPAAPLVNVPLKESANERARGLVGLSEKFLTDQAKMPPAAAAYQRRRPTWFDDPERVLREWGVGYLPMDAGGSHEGGTMRGKIVFPIRDLDGEILAFCGRDPGFEDKYREWLGLSEEQQKATPEPAKWRFPKGFHRGLELWGQERLKADGIADRLAAQGGLVVVEGPGDVIRLDRAGVVAVGLMSNLATGEQVARIADIARRLSDAKVQLMLDLDDEGRKGMASLLHSLSPEAYVRVLWTSATRGGKFAGREPEEIPDHELTRLLSLESDNLQEP